MYDTVNFWVSVELLKRNIFDIQRYLPEITERQNEKSGYSCSGMLDNYNVSIYGNGISLKGSLSKYYYGDNIHTLTRQDTQKAIEKLSDNLHLDLMEVGKVTRLDIATVIPTKYAPTDYYPFMGNKTYFERLQATNDTLYYNNHQRQIAFYDKIKEANKNKVEIPLAFQNSNLLRYELRYIKRLKQQFRGNVIAKMLYNTEFFRAIIQTWHNEFKTIQKLQNKGIMIEDINTVKDAETALFATLLKQAGQSVIDEYLNTLKANNVFKERQRHSELKRKLNGILQTFKGENNNLIKELETEISNIAKYAQ